uniref:Uncharacterized protein n=1 Tax=Setaria viridis TaxID=4556 RepID=A0A4U6T2G8_SETVI|nr:hypothetical protein SEVIR_9G347350v2 [Setaria viridis]
MLRTFLGRALDHVVPNSHPSNSCMSLAVAVRFWNSHLLSREICPRPCASSCRPPARCQLCQRRDVPTAAPASMDRPSISSPPASHRY